MRLVYNQLLDSEHGYVLPTPQLDALGRPQSQFLLLEFTNAGRRSQASNAIFLCTSRANLHQTVHELLAVCSIAIPSLAVRDQHFQLHMSMYLPYLSYQLVLISSLLLSSVFNIDFFEIKCALQDIGLGTDPIMCRHHCLPKRFHFEYYYGTDLHIPIPSTESGVCNCPVVEYPAVVVSNDSIMNEEPEEHEVREALTVMDVDSNNMVSLVFNLFVETLLTRICRLRTRLHQ
jgi:hypothetical protein